MGARRGVSVPRGRRVPSRGKLFVMDIRKECTCGRRYNGESWSSLRLLGTMDNGRKVGELLELRLCSCGTSLAVPIGIHAPSLSPSSSPSVRRLPSSGKRPTVLVIDDD